MGLFQPFLPLHPFQPGAMSGDGAAGSKKQILSSKSLAVMTRTLAWKALIRDRKSRRITGDDPVMWKANAKADPGLTELANGGCSEIGGSGTCSKN